jgi:tRNA pseudouridine55 synthase
MRLGQETNTHDREGDIVKESDFENLTNEEIESCFKQFLGVQEQVPPMFSAKKHQGQALYHFARKGHNIEREPVQVTIHELGIDKIDTPFVEFFVKCSKGTYIRSLVRDIGRQLGCGAHLHHLKRLASGGFGVDEAITLDELKELSLNSSWKSKVRAIEKVLDFGTVWIWRNWTRASKGY